MSWKKRFALLLGSGFLLLVVLVVVGYVLTTVPQPSKISTDQSTVLEYSNGNTIGAIGKNRTIVPLSEIDIDAQHAILAAEDRNFYHESGISLRGIARALFTNLKDRGTAQGGSTITQQYAKNAFLTQQRTYTRKIKEVFIAVKMSQTVSKDTILADYLNTIYFGRGAYGIEAASETYFSVHASQLSPTQAAVLAGSVQSPALLDPENHPTAALTRWKYVIKGMHTEGWLSDAAYAAATYPKVNKISSNAAFPGTLDYIREQVVADLEKHGFDDDRIAEGGLVVRTTINQTYENAAIDTMDNAIPASTRSNPPVGALVSIQPGTGRVLAYYGGRNSGGFDYASDGKVQPGSSMKPYVLATALSNGKSLDTEYDGSSPQDICGQQDAHNDEGDPPFGDIDLTTALQFSVNTVYLRLACDIGPSKVAALAHAAGIPASDKLDGDTGTPTDQIALGSGGYEVRPIDQADGYATFAAAGVHATATFVESVSDTHKHVYYSLKPARSRAFSAAVAADTTYAMTQVVSGGTATRAQLAGGRPVAGKTGTTGNNANAWFVGFTPQVSTAVWIGNAHGGPLVDELGIQGGVYGGTIPAEIFKTYTDAALAGTPVMQFPPRAYVGTTAPPTYSPPPATATPTVTATPTTSPTPTPTPNQTPSQTPTLIPPVEPSETPTPAPSATPTASASP